MTPSTSRICASALEPTLPCTRSVLRVDTARLYWHWAADGRSVRWRGRVRYGPRKRNHGSWTSGAPHRRRWEPRTLGAASRIRCAVTTTAGWRKPASCPVGNPRSRSTTSPEVSIEPVDLIPNQKEHPRLHGWRSKRHTPHARGRAPNALGRGSLEVSSRLSGVISEGAQSNADASISRRHEHQVHRNLRHERGRDHMRALRIRLSADGRQLRRAG